MRSSNSRRRSDSARHHPRADPALVDPSLSHPPRFLSTWQLFEEGKVSTAGLHFLSVQEGPDAEQPDGFWLLKDMEAAR